MGEKTTFVGAAGVLAAGLALAAAPAVAQQANVPHISPDLADKTAEQVYKNIQVLKGVPAGEILPLMRLIDLSLGVTCEHCHDEEDHSLDVQEAKETARSMMSMVNELNKNSFAGQPTMTCYSCHRGAVEPVAQAVLPGPDDSIKVDEKAPTTATYPTADQLIAKHVEALGGEQALRAVTSRVITATGDVPSGPRNEPRVSARIETYQKAPNLTLTITRMPDGIVSTGFDGQSAWMQNPDGAVTQFNGLELTRARRDADFYQPLDLKSTYLRFVVGGIEPVNNRDAYILIAAPRGGDTPERLYFDTQTGLLVRRQTVVSTPFGNSPMNVDYEQYRDAGDGTKYPFLIRTTTVTQRYVVRVERVQNNAAVDNARFARPAAPAAR